MKNTLILLGSIVTLMACCPAKRKVEPVSTIDSTLQVKVDSIMQDKMAEKNAHKGQVIVMEVQTGQIKAMVGLERKDSASYIPYEYTGQPSGLVRAVSILAALETGKVKLSDVVDTELGICDVNGYLLKDHNWYRGGYGKLTIQQALEHCSSIGTYKAVKTAFGDNEQAYFDMLVKINYAAELIMPKDSVWNDATLAFSCIGRNQAVTPMQMLTFYNAIANNGTMVQPQTHETSTVVINPQIASKANIDSMRIALQSVVSQGLGKRAHSEKVLVAGQAGTLPITDEDCDSTEMKTNTEFIAEWCGYFPAENPKYSIIVTMNKMGYPASGSAWCGDTFRRIVDYMVMEYQW